MKIKHYTVRLLAISLLVCLFCTALLWSWINVSAGVVPNETASDETVSNNSDWRISDGVEITSAGIKFSSSLISSRAVRGERLNDFGEYGIKNCFNAKVVFKVGELPENRLFGMIFGLPYISDTTGTKGSSLFYFQIDGGTMYCGLNMYAEENIPTAVIGKTAIKGISAGDTFRLNIVLNNDGSVTASVSKEGGSVTEVSCGATENLSGDGYFGFGQIGGSGNTEAYISSVIVNSYRYETPKNTTYAENFADGAFNIECFSAGMMEDGGELSVSDGLLTFNNTADAFFSTRYDYSNVVLDFDIVQLQENSAPVSVAIGADSSDVADVSPVLLIKIGQNANGSGSVISFVGDYGVEQTELPARFHIWSQEATAGRVVNVRIYSVDGQVRILMKYADEIGFCQVAQYSTAQNTPCGKVQIQGMRNGNATGNFSLSYIAIGNLDVGAHEVVIGYTSSDLFIPPDYVYEDLWSDADLPFSGVN